jgi:hypothetical protein
MRGKEKKREGREGRTGQVHPLPIPPLESLNSGTRSLSEGALCGLGEEEEESETVVVREGWGCKATLTEDV